MDAFRYKVAVLILDTDSHSRGAEHNGCSRNVLKTSTVRCRALVSSRVAECKCFSGATLTNCFFLGGSVFLTWSFEWALIERWFCVWRVLPAIISCAICAKISLRESKFKLDMYFPYYNELSKWNYLIKGCLQSNMNSKILFGSIKKWFSSNLSSLCGNIGTRRQNLKCTIVYVYMTACVQCMSLQRNNTAGLWGVGGRFKKIHSVSCVTKVQK